MNILIIKLILGMALPALSAGALLLYIFRGYKMPWLFTAALSYLLGAAMVAIWMMALGFSGLPLSWPFIGWPLIINFIIFLVLLLRSRASLPQRSDFFKRENVTPSKLPEGMAAKIVLFTFYGLIGLYVAINVYEMLWRAFVMPIYTWDAIATIAFKAKILYSHQSFDIYPLLPHAKYPMLVTFLEVWTALNLGSWHEQFVKAIFPLGSLSFLVVCYYFLAWHTNRAWGLLGVTLILSSNMYLLHSTISYRDLYVTIYFCLTILCLLIWARIRHAGLMILAGFFAGVVSSSKYEGSGYVVLLLGVLAYLLWALKDIPQIKKVMNFIYFSVPSLTILLSFHIYKKLFTSIKLIGNEERDSITFVAKDLGRIPETLYAYFHCLFLQNNWGIVWFIFALSLIAFIFRKKTIEKQILLISIVLFLILYIALAVATPSYKWLVGPERMAGLARLFLHFFPLAPLFIILNCYEENFLGWAKKEAPANLHSPRPAKIKNKAKKR